MDDGSSRDDGLAGLLETPLSGTFGVRRGRWRQQSDPLGDGNGLRKRLNLQLFHHHMPMRLDGSLGGAELKGNLLVHFATNHQRKHFVFSGRQGRNSGI